jgi:hypothetical protein
MKKQYDYKCDVCHKSLYQNEYYNETDNIKFKPNIILTICDQCSTKIKNFIRDLKERHDKAN